MLVSVEHQAVTVPGPQPQRGPPAATGKANQEEKKRQQTKYLSCHPETSAVPIVVPRSLGRILLCRPAAA